MITNSCNTPSLQLTDTLSGILPIVPTDESLLGTNREEDLQNRKNLVGFVLKGIQVVTDSIETYSLNS